MADSKISALTALASGHATGDLLPLVDVSDTTQAASGTTKKSTLGNLLANLPVGIKVPGGGGSSTPDIGIGTGAGISAASGNAMTFITDYGNWAAWLLRGSYFATFNNTPFAWSSNNGAPDTYLSRPAAGVIGVRGANITTGGALEFIEQTAPAAPSANGVRIYAVDNGGKTELLALFASGAAQRLAIEP